jgi:hypothetical protein
MRHPSSHCDILYMPGRDTTQSSVTRGLTAAKQDISLPTLRTQSVIWFVMARNTISNPEFIKKAHKQCIAGEFNLSFEVAKSSHSTQKQLHIQKNSFDPWEKISVNPLHDIDSHPFEVDKTIQGNVDFGEVDVSASEALGRSTHCIRPSMGCSEDISSSTKH